MSLSSGTKSLLGTVLRWAFMAVVTVAAITHYDELKRFSAELMGLPSPEEPAAAQEGGKTKVQENTRSGTTVELKAGGNGHFQTEAEINGRGIDVLVDTGASMVALTYEDAERAGIRLKQSDFTQGVSTANGIARVAPVTLDRVSIGDITVRNVKAAVSERGRLQTTLLGMTFLSRLGRVDMRSGVLVLED